MEMIAADVQFSTFNFTIVFSGIYGQFDLDVRTCIFVLAMTFSERNTDKILPLIP